MISKEYNELELTPGKNKVLAQERRLAAVMFVDIAGSTNLMQSDEGEAIAHLQRFKNALMTQVPKHHGEVIQFYGDGCLCLFRSSVEAGTCAIALQRHFIGELNLPVRIGLHSGDVLFKDGHAFGDSINIASRIESLAMAGSVLFSERVKEEIENKSDLPFTEMGSFVLKNVQKTISVYALTSDFLYVPQKRELEGKLQPQSKGISKHWLWLVAAIVSVAVILLLLRKQGQPPVHDKSIAVLPFVNMTSDQELNYFGDGIMDDILTNLGQIGELKVISRTSAMLYRNSPKSIPEIAEELGVAYIVEGSVQKDARKIKIISQLIRARDDQHVWSENYIRDLNNILDVQSEVSQEIARSLHANIAPKVQIAIRESPTDNLQAYNLFQEARHLIMTRTREGLEEGIRKLDQALDLDPEYDRAMGEKALAVYLLANVGYADPRELNEQAEQIARKTIALNDRNAQVYGILGGIYRDRLQWEEAIDAYRKGLEISPNDALLNYWYALALREIRAFDLAIQYGEKASELDPLYAVIHMGHTVTCTYAGAFDKASAILEQKRGLFGDSFLYHWASTILHLAREDYDAAIRSSDTALMINPNITGIKAIQAMAYGKMGREDTARHIMSELPTNETRTSVYRATIHLGLGQVDSVFYYVDKSNASGVYKMDLGYAPWFKPLQSDPRYAIMLQQMRLLNTEQYLDERE